MSIEYISSSSTVEPQKLDDKSSTSIIYVRKNITAREEEQSDGSVVTYYDYDEAKIDKNDWKYLASILELENNQETQDNLLLDIDYRLMMLEESANE